MSTCGQNLRSVLDRKELWDRVGNDPELLSELLRLFREQNLQRVLEIRTSIRAGDGEGLCAAAHALKGAIGNFSVHGAFGIAARLQEMRGSDEMQMAASLCDLLESQLRGLESELDSILHEPDEWPATPGLAGHRLKS